MPVTRCSTAAAAGCGKCDVVAVAVAGVCPAAQFRDTEAYRARRAIVEREGIKLEVPLG